MRFLDVSSADYIAGMLHETIRSARMSVQYAIIRPINPLLEQAQRELSNMCLEVGTRRTPVLMYADDVTLLHPQQIYTTLNLHWIYVNEPQERK